MNWFIVAMMSIIHTDGGTNMFIFNKQFETQVECKTWVKENVQGIHYRLLQEFGPHDRPRLISCVNEDTIEKIIDDTVIEKEMSI